VHTYYSLLWSGGSVPGLPEQDDGDATTRERRVPHSVLQTPDTAVLSGHRLRKFTRCGPYATDDDAASRGALASPLLHVQL
jgi:hypothetical protein